MSVEEGIDLEAMFDRYDTDGSNSLDEGELYNLLKENGINVPDRVF